MLLGFKRRFAPMVEDGSKTHTIRGTRKVAPKVGEICHCYVDPRQKTMRLLGRWECIRVEEIHVYDCGGYGLGVRVDGIDLSKDEKNALAWRDGFRNRGERGAFAEMSDYWRVLHPVPRGQAFDFFGHIIHWKYTPGGPHARG